MVNNQLNIITFQELSIRLVSKPYDSAMLEEFDRMGRVHKFMKVELIHMQALLAFMQDTMIAELFNHYNSGIKGMFVYLLSKCYKTTLTFEMSKNPSGIAYLNQIGKILYIIYICEL